LEVMRPGHAVSSTVTATKLPLHPEEIMKKNIKKKKCCFF